ncbi:MAG: methyltransferase type 11, partial [Pandoraea sp.]|nr:methyltransferase type 11 [Pandoraea sp.]
EGRSIVIWSEFGLGDEIFFLRFAAMLKDQMGASRVSVVCQDPLYELFQTALRVDAVYSVSQAQAGEVPYHDCWVYPYDIPAYLSLDLEHLPASVPYCHATRTELLPVKPGRESALKVGIVFKGAPTHENDQWRSLSSLSVLDPLFERDDVIFYSLQKGEGAVEAATYAARLPNFIDLGPTLQTFSDTAACVAAMDLIISVDTSVANLAGAMGKPLCVLLPPYGDWRWHYLRDDSPWNPSAALFRRPLHENWGGVVSRVKAYLDTFASSDARCPAERAAGAVNDMEVANG